MTEETSFSLSKSARLVPITITLIALSVAIAVQSHMGKTMSVMAPFFIASPQEHGFQSIQSGEVWRLITPVFLHFGILHLVFNMIWLWDLGSILERIKGHIFMASFVLIVGSAANVGQFVITGSQYFGGMSGVVYGLFGYVWMHSRRNPDFQVALHKQTVVLMVGWFIICWLGLLGPIANWEHTFGLGIGLALGSIKPERHPAG